MRSLDFSKADVDPAYGCGQPVGVPRQNVPGRIIRKDKQIVLVHNVENGIRILPLDGRQRDPQDFEYSFYNGQGLARWDGDTLVIESVGFNDISWLGWEGNLLFYSFTAQRPTAPPLEIRALSAKPELVSGGDVLVEIAGPFDSAQDRPASLTVKSVTVRLNGKDVTASFKPAAESKALVGLLTDLQVGSNAVQASMRGSKATAQLTIVNHPISGPVIYSPHQTPFICETQANGLGADSVTFKSQIREFQGFRHRRRISPLVPHHRHRVDANCQENRVYLWRGRC